MDIVSDLAQATVQDSDFAIMESAQQKHSHISQCPFQAFPDYFEQCACDLKMMIDLVHAYPPNRSRRERGRQVSEYQRFDEDYVAEIVDMCVEYLKPGGHTNIFCSSVLLSPSGRAVPVATESVTF